MVTVEIVAQYAGTSVEMLEVLADRLPKKVDFVAYSYRTRNGTREIVTPGVALDTVTKNLHRSFTAKLPYRPPDHVHGFVKGRSTLSNATEHLNKRCVLRVDLEEFFPSINSSRVITALESQGFDRDAAELCTRVITIEGRLPIGLSTSPYVSNVAFEPTDAKLVEYAIASGLTFTRYVDDMIFSGDVRDQDLAAIKSILARDG